MSKFKEDIVDAVRLGVQEDVLRANIGAHGNIFWVVEDSDTDYNLLVARYGAKNVFTTLTDAYNACTTNRNDIIFMHGQSSHTIGTTGLAWTAAHRNPGLCIPGRL